MNTLNNELQPITRNANLVSDQFYIHLNDPTGKSKIKPIIYEMISGDWIGMQCYNFSDEYILNHGVTNNLEIFLSSEVTPTTASKIIKIILAFSRFL